ncbi:MAG: hypothetical protein QMD00_02330 [Hadesarchaea archaeon]|nr:hypothetical protein [Hadesarchaea archaeon]
MKAKKRQVSQILLTKSRPNARVKLMVGVASYNSVPAGVLDGIKVEVIRNGTQNDARKTRGLRRL